MAAPIRILLIDDHQLFRTGLGLILAREPRFTVVGEAGDAASALTLALKTTPDLLLADIHLPGADGIEIVRQIRVHLPSVKAIFLSSDSDIRLVRRALDAGGNGYLLKDHATQDLLRALDAAANGGVFLPPEIASALLNTYRTPPAELAARSAVAPPALSARELDVLRLIAEGLRNKEIADRLGVSIKSVETYRSRLLHKLGYDSTAELVRHAIREGLIKA